MMQIKQILISVSFLCLSQWTIAADYELYLNESYRAGGQFESYQTRETLEVHAAASTDLVYSHRLDATRFFELLYSRQSTELRGQRTSTGKLFDVDISYLHLGGTSEFYQQGKTVGYGVGGLGATHYSPSNGFSSETRFSMSFGVGVKHYVSEHLVLRADAKLFATFLNSEGGIFCGGSSGGNGGCAVVVDGDVAAQYAVGAGLGFRF